MEFPMTQAIASPTLTSPQPNRSPDQQIRFPGNWESFELIQQALADSPGAKLSFYNGTIEILMPGAAHEKFAHIIGYLLTTFLLENGIKFVPSRQKDQVKQGVATVQADESYCIGQEKDIPDLSIEVVFTSGGPSKLKIYAALGVPEVWFWEDGVLSLYHLRSDEQTYEKIMVSELPGLDRLNLDLLQCCILQAETDFPGAVAMLRAGN